MNIEIVSIGDELLKGRIVNTNGAFLCSHLSQSGFKVGRQTTLSDQDATLLSGLQEALMRSDVVICTGGLGPTLDDRTREAAAALFGCGFRMDPELAARLKKRYQHRYQAVEDQSRVPEKARLFSNRVGSAPGLLLAEKGKTLILMPGVPKEMEPMFLEEVLPFLENKWPAKERKSTVQLYFCLIYESLLDTHLREISTLFPLVEVGIYPAHGTLCVTLASSHAEQLKNYQQELERRFSNYIFSTTSSPLAEALMHALARRKKKLCFAESCTGGMLASLVTAIPGASDYFLGSFVVYSNAMKENVLNVSKQTLLTFGDVSEQTVREMAEGVFTKTDADYVIAVSGVAGPTGGSEEHPVGTIWAAIGERGKPTHAGKFMSFGSRETIILSASHQLLGALWRKVEKGIDPFPFLPS